LSARRIVGEKLKQFLCDEIAEIMEVQECSENGTHSRIRRGPCHEEFSWPDLFSSGCDCISGRFALNLLRFSVFCLCVGRAVEEGNKKKKKKKKKKGSLENWEDEEMR
jgi:hypothetical protein